MFDFIARERIASDASLSTTAGPRALVYDTGAKKCRHAPVYPAGMTRPLKDILWANIVTLMEREWGGENQRRLAREAGIAPGGSTRLKDPSVNVRINMLERVASTFGVEPWQLLAPGLGERLYVIDDDRRLAPVYAPNVHQLPAGKSRGGLRKSSEQKDRYEAQSKRSTPRKTGRSAA